MKEHVTLSPVSERTILFKSITGPVSDFSRTKTDRMTLAAWLMIPEHENWITEVSLVKEESGREKLEIGFTGFHVNSCEISFHYQKNYLKRDVNLKEGRKKLAAVLSAFFCEEQLESLIPGGVPCSL
jgi:hypothetical protein